MLATLEQPPPKRIVRWNKEQAAAAAAKSLDIRRKNSAKRKEVKAEAAQLLKAINCSDPHADVERALSLAAKRGNAKQCEHLALALARLKSAERYAPRAKPDPACGSYPTTNGISQRQPTPSAPQVKQAAHAQAQAHDASFAQYPDHLVQGQKESTLPGPVGTGGTGGTGPGSGVGGVIQPFTPTPNSVSEVEQLRAQVRELQAKLALVQGGSVKPSVEPSCGLVALDPHEGMEKFLVGGCWVWGKRKK